MRGQAPCEHQWQPSPVAFRESHQGEISRVIAVSEKLAALNATQPGKAFFCALCGAWHGSFGNEPTVQMYVDHSVAVLRAIRRVLRKDSVLWFNLGDSYASQPGQKPKDMCLIPFRVALAAQADGWWVRSVIIWAPTNPQPESASDRPSLAHEYILMLTQSREYWYDADAVRHPHQPSTLERIEHGIHNNSDGQWGIPPQNTERLGERFAPLGGRNMRSIWVFPTEGLPSFRIDGKKLDHFASYPKELPMRPILASCPAYICPSCNQPWARVVERSVPPRSKGTEKQQEYVAQGNRSRGAEGFNVKWSAWKAGNPDITIGWEPGCKCGLPQEQCIPGTVLDPFCGSGTTLLAARELGRRGIGIDISEDYLKVAIHRLEQTRPSLFQITEEVRP